MFLLCMCAWSVVSNSLQPNHALLSMEFSSENTGEMSCYLLLQRIFLNQGSNQRLLHFLFWRQILYHWATWKAPPLMQSPVKNYLPPPALRPDFDFLSDDFICFCFFFQKEFLKLSLMLLILIPSLHSQEGNQQQNKAPKNQHWWAGKDLWVLQ